MIDQRRLPIADMIESFGRDLIELCCPGNRRGRDVDAGVMQLLGEGAFVCDVTQVPGIDDLLAPQGAIAEAEQLAAATWNARSTHFLVGGTTSGLHAAMLATCQPGDVVLAPRASHRSVLGAFILSGAVPCWVPCQIDAAMGWALPPSDDALQAAARQAGRAQLAVLTRPTYYGDVASLDLIKFLQSCGTIVVVDEAWGAHLGFHPATPPAASQLGADIVVNSTHKMCTALSGGSMLHRCSDRVDAERLVASIRLLTTTSPYYGSLLALDGARRQMALEGFERVAHSLSVARRLREALAEITGVRVAGAERAGQVPGVLAYDETRVAFNAAALGYSGYEIESALRQQAGVCVELSDTIGVMVLIGAREDGARIQPIVDTMGHLPPRARQQLPTIAQSASLPPMRMTPREAFLASSHSVPARQACGRVAAEVLCIYPPGVPSVCPGEVITEEVLSSLQTTLQRGGRLQGAADPTLATVRVVR